MTISIGMPSWRVDGIVCRLVGAPCSHETNPTPDLELMQQRTRIKICCMKSVEEVAIAVAAGADALGLVGPQPSGPGVLGEEESAGLAPYVPPSVSSVYLSAKTSADDLARDVALVKPAILQVVQEIGPAEHGRLRELLSRTGVRTLQVIHVEDANAIDRAKAYEDVADGLLLDSGRPSAAIPEFGGTGRTHDWEVSARLVAAVKLPVFLAGGLHSDNVVDAIKGVRPYGLDLCSGVRTDDALDEEKLVAFMRAVRSAEAV